MIQVEEIKRKQCPFGCQTRHLLAACPHYQSSTFNQKWEMVKSQRCRKCPSSHHTRDCKKFDCSTCNKCKKNHHRSLHNDRKVQETSNLNPKAPPYPCQNNDLATSNANVSASSQNHDTKVAAGLLPIQMLKVQNSKGQPIEILAMLDTGSNTSLLSKSAAKKLGLSGPQTHLTMNLAGGNKKV